MTEIELKPVPPSVNHMYGRSRFGGTFKTKVAKDIQNAYGWQCKTQTKDYYIGDICVEVIAYFADKRKHDVDNLCKATLDSLTGILWKDDGQITDLIVRKRFDKKNPRLIIKCDGK